eukprot:4423018-Prymnesium_polylepis.1
MDSSSRFLKCSSSRTQPRRARSTSAASTWWRMTTATPVASTTTVEIRRAAETAVLPRLQTRLISVTRTRTEGKSTKGRLRLPASGRSGIWDLMTCRSRAIR